VRLKYIGGAQHEPIGLGQLILEQFLTGIKAHCLCPPFPRSDLRRDSHECGQIECQRLAAARPGSDDRAAATFCTEQAAGRIELKLRQVNARICIDERMPNLALETGEPMLLVDAGPGIGGSNVPVRIVPGAHIHSKIRNEGRRSLPRSVIEPLAQAEEQAHDFRKTRTVTALAVDGQHTHERGAAQCVKRIRSVILQ
jgi:hypothetical protein